jgi:hypothetical protein
MRKMLRASSPTGKGSMLCSRDSQYVSFHTNRSSGKLDRAGELFCVLIVKTNLRIAYTSVFFELECGYWNAQAEKKLRAAMRFGDRPRKLRKRKLDG